MANRKIPYSTILAATQGDPDAINTILRHFDNYIEANSYHPSIEGFPGSGGGLNVDIKAHIQDRLIRQIIRYREGIWKILLGNSDIYPIADLVTVDLRRDVWQTEFPEIDMTDK